MTVDQLIDRYGDDRSTSWALPADAETRARVAQHLTPYVASIVTEWLHPVDVQQRLDLIVRNLSAKTDHPTA